MRLLRWPLFIAPVLVILLGGEPGSALIAATIYDEAVSGDLSDSGLTPTSLTFGVGSNQVFGTTGRGTTQDRDYFTFTVPSGLALTAVTLLPGTTTQNLSFVGLQAGPQVTLPVSPASAAGLLGWSHYRMTDINTNLLIAMSVPANGSSGFSIPLGPGSYSIWVQETGAGSYNYGFDFTLVPEPSSALLVLAGVAAIGIARRQRRVGRPLRPRGALSPATPEIP